MLEYLLFIYYACILGGTLLFTCNLLHKPFAVGPLPQPVLWLMAFGLMPVAISWAGYAGFFRIPGMAVCTGLFFACYLLAKRQQAAQVFRLAYNSEKLAALFIIAIGIALMIPKYCYFQGGINNSDETRALAITNGFAANYLKPAFPFNLSIPISYSYYPFQISAYLYAMLDGYSWPTVSIALIGLVCVTLFYTAFTLWLRELFPVRGRYTLLFGNAFITFFGIDMFLFKNPMANWHVDRWNWIQVSTMATFHQWVYNYLSSLGLGLCALLCFTRYITTLHRHWLYACVLFALLSLTFGAITGAWVLACIAGVCLAFLLRSPDKALATFKHTPMCLFLAVLVLLPQFFTFVGRDTLVILLDKPALWFSRRPIEEVGLHSWLVTMRVFFNELGPLLMAGLLSLPLLSMDAIRKRHWPLFSVAIMALVTMLMMTMLSATWPDWFWRGGNLLLLVFSSVGALWLCEWLRMRINGYALHAVILVGLLPGIANYYAESLMRYRNCFLPLPALKRVNQMTDLHTIFYKDEILSQEQIMLSGRTFFDPVANRFIVGYRNLRSVRSYWLHFPEKQTPCQDTWFGSPLPNGSSVLMQKPRVFIKSSCTPQK